MSSLNKVTLIGHLGRDPDIRSMRDGEQVVNFSLATSDKWRDKQSGERREKTEWHRITIYNTHLCKVAEQYLKKGSQIYLEGKLQTRKWKDQQGVEKFSTEVVLQQYDGKIVMLGKGGEEASSVSNQPEEASTSKLDDDEIPF